MGVFIGEFYIGFVWATVLLVRLREVASRTKHLAIVRGRMSTLRPRLDVVCVHLVDVELLAKHITHDDCAAKKGNPKSDNIAPSLYRRLFVPNSLSHL